MKPSDDPRADELRNKNLSEPASNKVEPVKNESSSDAIETEKKSLKEENQNGEI